MTSTSGKRRSGSRSRSTPSAGPPPPGHVPPPGARRSRSNWSVGRILWSWLPERSSRRPSFEGRSNEQTLPKTSSAMPFARLCGVLLFAVLVFGALAPAADAAKPLRAPKGLKAFLLRVDERESVHNRTFPRTPAFAWRAVSGAKRYEFELSTSKTFSEGAVVWSSATAKVDVPTPAISPGVSLPWITGNPYSLYARVRAIAANGKDGLWSAPFGFNMRWRDKPRPLDPQFPGLMRWTPIEGATMYEVWLFGTRQHFLTTTNVADEREFYTFHTDSSGQYRTNPVWSGAVRWRIRAVRKLYGDIPNGLPATTYGPWSDTFTNFNPPHTFGELAPLGTVSGSVFSPPNAPQAHELTPAFLFSGNYRSWGNPWRVE